MEDYSCRGEPLKQLSHLKHYGGTPRLSVGEKFVVDEVATRRRSKGIVNDPSGVPPLMLSYHHASAKYLEILVKVFLLRINKNCYHKKVKLVQDSAPSHESNTGHIF